MFFYHRSITTSIGVAGGGGVGCFLGASVVALVFYRRKKPKAEPLVDQPVVDKDSVIKNDLFESNQHLHNPLL